jgi:hypothetical protein
MLFLTKRVKWMMLLVAAALLLVACSSGDDSSGQDDEAAGSPPAAAVAAQEALAAELGVEPESVTIQSYEQMEWSDSCLGLGGPAESCLAAIHPGWQVMLEVDGVTYEVRTDETADIIRINQ